MRHVPAIIFLLMVFAPVRGQPVKAQDFLAKSRAAYAALKSYRYRHRDGRVRFGRKAAVSNGTHSRPTTARPATSISSSGKTRTPAAIASSCGTTAARFTPGGRRRASKKRIRLAGVPAHSRAACVQTAGSLLQIAPLLFPQAGLQGALTGDRRFVCDGRRTNCRAAHS